MIIGLRYLVLSLLGGCFVSWFLFPLWILEECDGCVLPGRKFSLDLFPQPAELMCSQGMLLGVGG